MSEIIDSKLNSLVAKVHKVRRWLLALAILKVAAICLIFVSVYVGIYIWLDHRIHFGENSRVVAFILLVGGVAFLLYRLVKLLLGHISYSCTANYIESKQSFDQQLVTAVEYYEKKLNYPYSKSLAEQLIIQIDKSTDGFEFNHLVPKWLAGIFAVIILLGLSVVTFYLCDNYVYFSSYLKRLFQPLAAVEPLPATTLESITQDIVTEPNSVIELSAKVKGRIPDFGTLVLESFEPNSTTENFENTVKLQPILDKEGEPRFEATKSFTQRGWYRYRFEADAAQSPWHKINVCSIPKIKSISANVTLGKNSYIHSYEKAVNDYTLELAKNSSVRLTIEATEELEGAAVTGMDGKTEIKKIDGKNKFDFNFIAKRDGFIKFKLSSQSAGTNENIPALQVKVKADEPVKFKLLSPDGDYLATNVASVPITFEVADDFEINSAALCMEIAGRKSQVLKIPVEKGTRKSELTYILELEEYNLAIGDSILFYAEANDIDTGYDFTDRTSTSDIYFIEIRPYRQRWHQEKPSLPVDAGKQGLEPDKRFLHEQLLSVLEYTRAILKKTWNIANKPGLTDEDRSKLDYINDDVQYCIEQLKLIRDDPRYNFTSDDKATLNEVINFHGHASKHLTQHKPVESLVSQKEAYRILRRFVVELEKKLCPPGTGSPPKERDKIKMEEPAHLTRYEKERIEWELKKLTEQLAEIAAEQKRLKREFKNFLEQDKKKNVVQKTTDEKSWIAENEKPPEGSSCPMDPNQETGTALASNVTVEGALKPPPKTYDPGNGQEATSQEKMKMLQAKHELLQAKLRQLSQTLEQLPEEATQDKAEERKKIQTHLDKAVGEMERFQAKLAESYYQPEVNEPDLANALEIIDSANQQLAEAINTLENILPKTDNQILAKNAQRIAEELAELANDLDESVTDNEREQMLAMLEEAKRTLMMMQNELPQELRSTIEAFNESDGDLQKNSGGGAGLGLVDTDSDGQGSQEDSIKTAIFLARQFWSIAINAKKYQNQLIENEVSDAEFYELERRFFEDAAGLEYKQVKE